MGDIPARSISSIELPMGETEMPTQSSSTAELSADDTFSLSGDIWIWIIEYFAIFKKDLAMIHDVFEMGPELPDDLGKRVNEMVAFRCLVYLFDPINGDGNNMPSGSEPKVEFDLSESCEHVLQCILDEISLSDLKPGAPELSKWNALPFITHKRNCLPKCKLELLRDAVRERRDPIYASLRGSSGLFFRNQQERMSAEYIENNEGTPGIGRPDGSQRLEGKRDSIPQAPANRNGQYGDGSNKGNSLCPEANSCDTMIAGNLARHDDGNQDTTDDNLRADAEKLKLDAADTNVPAEQPLISLYCTKLSENDPKHITEAEEGHNSSKYTEAGSQKESRSLVHDHDEIEMRKDVNVGNYRIDFSDNSSFLPHVIDKERNFSTAELQAPGNHSLNDAQERDDPAEDKGENQTNYLHEGVSIDIMNQNEKIDDAMRVIHPSSSSANRYICMKCEKDGRLLLCSGEKCPIMVHETCLRSPPEYDFRGNFYCPQCAYTLSASEYLKSKREVSAAKKKLAAFLDLLNPKLKQKKFLELWGDQGPGHIREGSIGQPEQNEKYTR